MTLPSNNPSPTPSDNPGGAPAPASPHASTPTPPDGVAPAQAQYPDPTPRGATPPPPYGATPVPPQPPGPASPYSLAPPSPNGRRQRSTLGIIALVCSVVGLIFACAPGAFIIGWVLLPISFILGLVALFQRDQTRWQAVTAIIVAVVGAVVGAVVFLGFAVTAVDEALSGGTVSVAPPEGSSAGSGGSDGAASGGSADEQGGTRENPLPLGTKISNSEWEVVVNSVTFNANEAVLAANEPNDEPPEGSEYILINYSVTYVGDDPEGATPDVSVNYVTPSGVTIYSSDTMAVAPDAIDPLTRLYNGGSITGNKVLTVPSASAQDGVLAVEPGLLADTVFVAVT